MVASLPRLRSDLATSRQVTAEGVIFVIKDALRDRFYRLPEEAYFIAENLDGQTPLAIIRRRTEEKFGAALPPEELNSFVSGLREAGLLDTGQARKGNAPRARRVQGSPLYLRVRFFDPDRLFSYLAPRIRFFFTPAFLEFSALVILCAVVVGIANWAEAVQNLPRLFQYSAIPVILLVVFVVITLHEFAHGLTCKHFGGEVHELGFFLIYLQPALYCNVSDAWLFPEKSKRLWVGFAGPYFELFLWALATIVWRVTDAETWVNYVALIVMTSSGIKTLFNFNPLIKLDGYYLLSDWLEIPNLRKKGFACFGEGIKKLFGAQVPSLEEMSPRERRVCFIYGLVAGVGSIWLLGYAIAKFGGSLLQQSQPLTFAIPAWFLAVKIRNRYRRLAAGAGGKWVDPDDPDSTDATMNALDAGRDGTLTTEQTEVRNAMEGMAGTTAAVSVIAAGASAEADPAAPNPVTVPEANPGTQSTGPSKGEKERQKKKRSRRRAVRRWATAVMLCGGAAAALFYLNLELRIKGPFDVLPVQNADVRASVEGIIGEIRVQEGQMVREGDVIARLIDRDLLAELKRTQAAIEETQAKLKVLVIGPRPEELDQARIEVAKDTEAVAFAASRRERDKTLCEATLVSRQQLEDSEANLGLRKGELAAAKSKLELLLAGSRPEEIEAMKATLASFQTQHSYLEEQVQLMRVLSPASGIVATPARQLMEMKHQLVKKGDLIAKVFELKTITAEMVVSERDIADVKVGQEIILKARAYPEMTFQGKVTAIAIAAQANLSSSSTALSQLQGSTPATVPRSAVAQKTVTITSEIDNSSLLLKPEMTGQAKISCGKRRLLDLVTRRIARTIKVEFWSWW
jgi:putative peptide zinc metalloprotease protein